MRPVLYIDIFFLVNWMMDAVLLLLTGRFLKRRLRLWRISAAAAAGALWACLCAAFSLSGGLARLISLAGMAAFMVQLTYPSREFRERLRACVCFYLAAVLTGGLIHAVYDGTAFGRFWSLWMEGTGRDAISVWLLAVAMAASFFAIELGRRYREASQSRERIQDVTLHYEGRQLTIPALWDSGNQLFDPFSGRVVHIVELTACEELLGADGCVCLRRLAGGAGHSLSEWPDNPISARLIPCRTLGNAHGLLPVIAITSLECADGLKQEKPLIGLSPVALSADGSYRMLLHSQTDKKRRNLQHDD